MCYRSVAKMSLKKCKKAVGLQRAWVKYWVLNPFRTNWLWLVDHASENSIYTAWKGIWNSKKYFESHTTPISAQERYHQAIYLLFQLLMVYREKGFTFVQSEGSELFSDSEKKRENHNQASAILYWMKLNLRRFEGLLCKVYKSGSTVSL